MSYLDLIIALPGCRQINSTNLGKDDAAVPYCAGTNFLENIIDLTGAVRL